LEVYGTGFAAILQGPVSATAIPITLLDLGAPGLFGQRLFAFRIHYIES
jgi:hypothetical protein